jgi:hypothetical protein
MKRRQFIKRGLTGTALFCIPGFGFYSCTKNVIEPTIEPIDFSFCSPVELPEEQGGFYVQFINGRDYLPNKLDITSWRLRLQQTENGIILREASLSFEEIATKYQDMEESFFNTFQCVGNTPGGFQISNGYFTGVPLRIYLENDLGVDWSKVNRVYFRCFDNYHTNHTKKRILQDDPTPAYLVYKFDGIPLSELRKGTLQHGFPVRMVVPEMLGMKSPKSIIEINASDRDDEDGYWESRPVEPNESDLTWSDIPPVKVNSRIYHPVNYMSIRKGTTIKISGVAFSGISPLAKMEIGIAKVRNKIEIIYPINWQEAEISGPPDETAQPEFDDSEGSAFQEALDRLRMGSWPHSFVWSLWSISFKVPDETGDYGLFARATDSSGNVQPFTEETPQEKADGNNASHALLIQVE